MTGKVYITFILLLVASVVGSTCNREAAQGADGDLSSGAPAASWGRSAPTPDYKKIDSHVHIYPTLPALARALEVLDRAGIGRFVLKSAGAWGTPRFTATLAIKRVLGDRIEFFANIDWQGIEAPDFGVRTADDLEKAHKAGAVGVKIFKALGLKIKRGDELVPVDDPALDPIFEKCGEIGLIVAMHTADPVAFFEPVTPQNERYAELSIAESWSFHGPGFPSHAELLAQRDRRLARHPGTTFLLIHLANHPEDLDYVDRLLDTHSNVLVDTSARVPEFGRHPAEKARAFFIKHQDRILFGSDFISIPGGMQLGSVSGEPPDVDDGVEFFRAHWRYFESNLPAIKHPTPIQGDWKVHPINLPPAVLKKLYHDNADRLIFDRDFSFIRSSVE
jgi:predicted TIM-barrel fold metal-dependent hydrolase